MAKKKSAKKPAQKPVSAGKKSLAKANKSQKKAAAAKSGKGEARRPATKSSPLKKAVKSSSSSRVSAKKSSAIAKNHSKKESKNLIKSQIVHSQKENKRSAIESRKPVVDESQKQTADKVKAETAPVTGPDGQPVKRVRKSSRKPLITLPPPPKIEVSNYPKHKVKNILVSQPKPVDADKNPYVMLGRKYNLNVTFRHFIKVVGLSAQDFRAQRIDILEHGAVILTSKLSVDHYFKMCNEMRVTVPETMKYFCINEQTAYYLQKYIQYRKRKIFFGHGTILDLVDVIRKNKDEKFLLPVSDVHKEQIVDFLDELNINYTKGIFYKTVSADLSDIKNLGQFDVLVFFTPAGIKSLKQNFPNFKQGSTRIAAFGHGAALLVKENGYRLDIFAPNPQNPSMIGALEAYIKEANKR